MKFFTKIKKSTIILIVVTIVAGLFFIAGLNKTHPFIFSDNTLCTSCNVVYKEDTGGVIIDYPQKRLIFVDSEMQATQIVDLTKAGSVINVAEDGCIADGQVKIQGGVAIKNGVYLSSESIVAYSMTGDMICEEIREEYAEDMYVSNFQLDLKEIYSDTDAVYGTFVSDIDVQFSTMYIAANAAYWLSVFWLIFAAIFFLIKYVIKKITKKGVFAILFVVAILLTAFFYTINAYKQMEIVCENTIIVTTKNLTTGIESELNGQNEIYSSLPEEEKANIVDSDNKIENVSQKIINDYITQYSNNLGTNMSLIIQLYNRDAEGNYYLLADSTQRIPSGTKIDFSDDIKHVIANHDINNVDYGQVLNGNFIFDCGVVETGESATINNSSAIIITVSCFRDTLIANQIETGTNLLINLLAIFIGIFITVKIIITYKKDIGNWKKEDKKNKADKMAHMSGIYTFVYKMADKIDGAIMVYVALSMCTAEDPATRAILAAIPLAAWSVGRWIGAFVATPLIKRLGERTVSIIISLAGIAIMAFMVYSIFVSDIYLYSVGKGLWGFFMGGIMYVLSDNMPLSASTDEKKKTALNSIQQSLMAAYLLGVLLGGYLSEYLGYGQIYIVGAALSVVILILSVIIFGRKKSKNVIDEQPKNKIKMKEYWKAFLKLDMIMYFGFYMVTCMLLGGYGTYLFPLYSDGAGISALLLSNINVFATALVFAIGNKLSDFGAKFDQKRILVVPNLIICAGLVCFIISPNIYWAIIMLFLGLMLDRMTRVGSKMYLVEAARKRGLDSKIFASNATSVNTAVYSAQAPLLSAFVGLGINFACAAVGCVGAVLLCVFGAYNKIQKKKESENNNDT